MLSSRTVQGIFRATRTRDCDIMRCLQCLSYSINLDMCRVAGPCGFVLARKNNRSRKFDRRRSDADLRRLLGNSSENIEKIAIKKEQTND